MSGLQFLAIFMMLIAILLPELNPVRYVVGMQSCVIALFAVAEPYLSNPPKKGE